MKTEIWCNVKIEFTRLDLKNIIICCCDYRDSLPHDDASSYDRFYLNNLIKTCRNYLRSSKESYNVPFLPRSLRVFALALQHCTKIPNLYYLSKVLDAYDNLLCCWCGSPDYDSNHGYKSFLRNDIYRVLGLCPND